MKWRVWLNRMLIPEAMAFLHKHAEVLTSGDLADLPGVDAVIVASTTVVDGAFMDRAGPRLKVIGRPGMGYDQIDVLAATERGILVVHVPDGPTESTAEHAVALMLALAKKVMLGDRAMRAGRMTREHLSPGMEVRGRVVGIVGLGRIGRRVAEICLRGLDMRVLAYDPYVPPAQARPSEVVLVPRLEDLLSQADFVTLHVPLLPSTRHLIGEREFNLMKPGAFLINTSRGPVVDEQALIRALTQGHLAGAALDVFDPEPPAPDNPLFQLPNVITTPHLGAYTDKAEERLCCGVATQVVQVLQGVRPPHLVNPEAWPGRARRTHSRGVEDEGR